MQHAMSGRQSKKDRKYNDQKTEITNRQTITHNALHRKLKVKTHEPHMKSGVNLVLREGVQFLLHQ